MNATDQTKTTHTRPVDREKIDRIAALLARYPGLTDGEIHEILLFLRKGPPLELGLLTSDERIKPKLDAFRKEHGNALSIGIREIVVIAVLLLLLLATVALLWDSGAGL